MSLKHKLTLLTVGGVVFTSLAAVLMARVFFTRMIEEAWEKRFHDFTEVLEWPLAQAVAEDNIVFVDAYLHELQLDVSPSLYVSYMRVLTPDGRVLTATEEGPEGEPGGQARAVAVSDSRPLVWLGLTVGQLEIRYLRTPIDEMVERMNGTLAMIAVVGSILAALIAARIGDRLVRPLTRLAKQIDRLGEDERVELEPTDSADEIGGITNALVSAYQELRKRGEHNREMVGRLQQVTGKLSEELAFNAQLREKLEEENRLLYRQVRRQETAIDVIGEDGDLKSLVAKAHGAAASNLSVLITGESGAGKEVFAALIQSASHRSEKPFVTVNCAALPENLIESELFGHEKGAFTGATTSKVGKFMLADGGTIFLDEIGELPLNMQPKLLRVLEAKVIDRVGADRPTRVDARVIAATNRDLEREVAAGRFRQDLYFRLKVVELRIPPLRERPNDLQRLLEVFLDEIAMEMRISRPLVSPAALAVLRRYSWPGNVRELRHILAATLSQHPVVVLEPEHFASVLPKASALAVAPLGMMLVEGEDFDTTIGHHERNLLNSERERCATQKEMAVRLGLSEARLHRLLKKHGLLRRGDRWSGDSDGESNQSTSTRSA